MRNSSIFVTMLVALAFAGVAKAQTGSGTLGINATVQGSINLAFLTDANGMAVTGTGTSTASLPLGTVSMYGGTVPANVTKTVNGAAISFNLSTPFDVRVDLANSASTTFTLSAMMSAADSVNVWTLGPTNISSGASFAVTSAGVYATAVPYTLKLTVPASEAGAISNSIGFTAIAN